MPNITKAESEEVFCKRIFTRSASDPDSEFVFESNESLIVLISHPGEKACRFIGGFRHATF